MITREMIKQIIRSMDRLRLVCSCETPDYSEDLFLLGEFRYRCGSCRGYIDLHWILEGYFPEPNGPVV